jgi:hypothetical protein
MIYVVGAEDSALDDALRKEGHIVEWVEPDELLGRVARVRPSLVILDAARADVRQAASELAVSLRDLDVGVFLIVGEPEVAEATGASSPEVPEGTGVDLSPGGQEAVPGDVELLCGMIEEVVSRPLDLDAVVDRITSLTRHRSGVTAAPPPPSSRRSPAPDAIGMFDGTAEELLIGAGLPPAPLLSYPPMVVETSHPPGSSSAPPGSGWPSSVPQPLGVGLSAGAFAGPTSVSAELEKLLAEAEKKVRSEANSVPDVPSPEAEVNAILPPEVLAALDDPLEVADDENVSGGAESQTPVGRGTTGGFAGGTEGASKPRGGTDAGDLASPAEPVTAHGEDDDGVPVWAESAGRRTAEGVDGEVISRDVDARPTPVPGRMEAREPWQRGLSVRDPGATPVPSGADYPPRTTHMRDPVVMAEEPFSAGPRTTAALQPGPVASAPQPTPRAARTLEVPSVLTPAYDGSRVLGVCIAGRLSATLCFEYSGALCRAVMRDGDFVTCGSSADDESLLAFLMLRGDLPREVGLQLVGKIPPFGRHAAAALIANGFVGQDQLWGVLRAHAEWLLGRMASTQGGSCALEDEPQGRLRAEPAVFGGATGAEVLVEVTQRVLPQEDAIARMGGRGARLGPGPNPSLLSECALPERERVVVENAAGKPLQEVLESVGRPEFAAVLAALQDLGVIEVMASVGRSVRPEPDAFDPLDAEAVRKRVAARLALIQEGDYFEVLGVPRAATSYEIRRAYLEARRAFEPSRLLTAQTADLADDARLIVEVLDEAYELLRDGTRRDRYRRAIEAVPPRP